MALLLNTETPIYVRPLYTVTSAGGTILADFKNLGGNVENECQKSNLLMSSFT